MKLGRKDYTIAFKTGTDANKAKFKKECVQGEIYHATDTGFFYVAEVTAGANDATLSQFGASAFTNQYSVSFDGTDDFMSVPSNASLNTSGDWSFSCWLYADDLSGYKALGARRTGGNSWQFAVNSSSLDLYLFSGVNFQSNSTLSTGQWFHVAFTVAVGVTDGVKMYINGTVQSNKGTTSTSSNNANYGMTFGDNTKNRWWNGELDEIAMFHTALSASDIATLRGGASAGTLGLPADISSLNPVAWWRMGDGTEAGSGTTVYDMSTNSNNGTLTNIASPNGFVTDVP